MTGTFANGIDNDRIDLALIGNVNLEYLESLIAKPNVTFQGKFHIKSFHFLNMMYLKPQFEKEALLLWES